MESRNRKGPRRPFDVVVFGATGCLGKLVAEYLASLPPQYRIMWTIAGRSSERLETLSGSLQKRNMPHPEGFAPIVADASDTQSLVNMCAQTSCIVNCVGPYMRTGEAVVGACLETITDYIDFCEEASFIEVLVEKYHQDALRKGVFILPSCGITSVLPDLTVLFAKSFFTYGHCYETRGLVHHTPIRRSQTSLTSINSNSDAPPDGLGRGSRKFFYDEDVKKWARRTFGAQDLIIERSNQLLETDRDFKYESYQEYESLGKLMLSYITSGLLDYFSYFYTPSRPGTEADAGPTAVERGVGFVRCSVIAQGKIMERLPQQELRNREPSLIDQTIVISAYSPNLYDGSVVIGVESFLLLSRSKIKPSHRGGVLTPSVLFGNQLIKSLREGKGFKFEAVKDVEDSRERLLKS